MSDSIDATVSNSFSVSVELVEKLTPEQDTMLYDDANSNYFLLLGEDDTRPEYLTNVSIPRFSDVGNTLKNFSDAGAALTLDATVEEQEENRFLRQLCGALSVVIPAYFVLSNSHATKIIGTLNADGFSIANLDAYVRHQRTGRVIQIYLEAIAEPISYG